MVSLWFIYFALCVLMTWERIHCDDDDDIKTLEMGVKPDGTLYTTGEIIEKHNKKSESHKVTTEDGYILTLFRILSTSTDSTPVLLQHGYLASSDIWVTDRNSLAFKLADAGFDVWINNIRGNAYSRNHVKLSPEHKEFWNFSWHEMGTKDLPAVIDYILRETNKTQLYYVGHSMGTTMGYVLLSLKPEYNEKIKSFINLSPVVYAQKLKEFLGPDGMVEEMGSNFIKNAKQTGKCEVFARKDVVANNKTQMTCEDVGEAMQGVCDLKCKELYEFLGGPYLPAGTSFGTMNQFYQMSSDGEMKHLNMSSKEENQKVYGSDEPPKYTDKFNKITTRILIWYAEHDKLIEPEDIDKLKAKLPNVVACNAIKEECFTHMHFLFSDKKSCLLFRDKMYEDCTKAMLSMEKE